MKNIYDIISEQKALVDINFASYELDYTINTINNNDLYVQEDFSNTVKNGAKKVVEFIKAVIEKLKAFFGKVKEYFFKRGTSSLKRLDEIKRSGGVSSGSGGASSGSGGASSSSGGASSSSGGASSSSGGTSSEANKYFDMNAIKGIKPENLIPEDLIKGSLRKVNVIQFVHINVKKELIADFIEGMKFTTGNYVADADDKEIRDVFVSTIKKKVFKGEGSYKKIKEKDNENVSIADRVHLEINEPREPEEVVIKNINEDIFTSYLYANRKDDKTDGKLAEYFKQVEDAANKDLKTIQARVEKNVNDDGASYANVQKVINFVASFLNYMTSNILKAFNTYNKLLNVVIGNSTNMINLSYGERTKHFITSFYITIFINSRTSNKCNINT